MRSDTPQSFGHALPSISENHRRRISAALGWLDQVLTRWAQYAEGTEDAGPLRRLHNDLAENQRQALGHLVAQIRELLAELRKTLDLKMEVRTVSGILPGECGILWETIAGLDPQHLRAWGETDPEFDAYWEPRRQILEGLLNQVLLAVVDKS